MVVAIREAANAAERPKPRVRRCSGCTALCLPTLAAKPPSGPDWVHEIKHDGYRLIVCRDG
jgi:ATP-dependent DNA ligase